MSEFLDASGSAVYSDPVELPIGEGAVAISNTAGPSEPNFVTLRHGVLCAKIFHRT